MCCCCIHGLMLSTGITEVEWETEKNKDASVFLREKKVKCEQVRHT